MNISIIIPCYNREDLVEETIQSIAAQSFRDFECIIVDDGSTDGTCQVIKKLIKNDHRFKLYQRPNNYTKGAPTCRNMGISKAQGDYIMFFDSDDLMTTNHLSVKYEAIINHKVDVVIAKTVRFDHPNSDKTYKSVEDKYHFKDFEINLYNFATRNLSWLTPDTLIKASFIKDLSFNPLLKRGQEYNFYCKLLVLNPKCLFVDKEITLRRMHEESIKSSFTHEEVMADIYLLRFKTILEIADDLDKTTGQLLLQEIILPITLKKDQFSLKDQLKMTQLIAKFFKPSTTFLYAQAQLMKGIFGRNFKQREQLKKALEVQIIVK